MVVTHKECAVTGDPDQTKYSHKDPMLRMVHIMLLCAYSEISCDVENNHQLSTLPSLVVMEQVIFVIFL